jgi:hypothetical protein
MYIFPNLTKSPTDDTRGSVNTLTPEANRELTGSILGNKLPAGTAMSEPVSTFHLALNRWIHLLSRWTGVKAQMLHEFYMRLFTFSVQVLSSPPHSTPSAATEICIRGSRKELKVYWIV